ncbi:MAG: hypothetical protein A2063_00995 [Gallionellales bacterium GWA2_60_142]|nr:MAG: hypothetical protein A2063_00995 [Gallionellales bacterium GWA2_60_142]
MPNRIGVDNPMQKAVSDAPLLMAALQRYGLVIQTNDPAAPLLLVAIDKSHHVTDGDLIAPQSLWLLFPNLDIRTIEVDGGIGYQPAPAIVPIQNNRLLATQFKNFPVPQDICLGIEILDRLTDL